jgi:chorismate mutase
MDKSTSRQVRAVRGATSVGADDRAEIVAATAELLQEVLARNDATPDDVVSVIFTATPDLTAAFPAAAARKVGMDDVPLLCASEIAVEGALPRCIRVMMHLTTERPREELQHVYLGAARELRADLFR